MSHPASSNRLEIRLLGPLEVLHDGGLVGLSGRRERSVLALLASNAGEPVSVDRLYRFLWGDDEPRTADKTLQTYMSRLRRALGDAGRITRREAGYVLDLPREAVDAVRFRDLVVEGRGRQQAGDSAGALDCYTHALKEWRGEQPAAAPDTPEATAWRQGLITGRLDALEAIMALMVRGGRHQEAASELEQLVVREPFRDELWALLMEALDAYQRARARLAEELGLDPSPRLQALQRRIIAQDAAPIDHDTRPIDQPAAARDDPSTRGRCHVVPPPAPLTALVGRDADRQRLTVALARSRLVTVVGTGGVGKTRLVLDFVSRWSQPVAFCDLAVVQDAEVIGHTLAAALGVDPEPGSDPVEAAAAALGGQELLLVVDNCEHLLTRVRQRLHVLLSRCPRLTVLATSRQALGIEGEVVVRLAALSIGDEGGDAARLFVERARRAGASIGDDARSRELVRSICATLDGLPLAIELAAAMAGALTLDELRRNLDDRFVLLQAPRLLAGRERNLRGTVDWSYRLLDPVAQRLFRRVSVFAGGFTADAAAAVCADDDLDAGAVVNVLVDLAGRSLLERIGGSRQTRFRMLETLRQYGRDLLDGDEATAASRTHAQWAVRTAQDLAARRFGPDEASVVDEFESVIDDLRVAMRWAMDTGDSGVALALAVTVHWFAFLGVRSELVDWIMRAADCFRDADHPLVGEAIAAAAMWQLLYGDTAGVAAAESALQALEARGGLLGPLAAGARSGMAAIHADFATAYRYIAHLYEIDPDGNIAMLCEGNIILLEHYAGRTESARRRAADLIVRREATGAPSLRSFAAIASAAILRRDEPDAALADLRRAIGLAREGRSLVTERIALSEAAALAAQASDPVDALAAIADALGAWQRDGLWRMEWGTLHNLMELLARLGRHRDLLVLDAARQASSTAPPLVGQQLQRLPSAVERAEAALGEESASAARAHGRAMTDDQAVGFARCSGGSSAHWCQRQPKTDPFAARTVRGSVSRAVDNWVHLRSCMGASATTRSAPGRSLLRP